MRTASRVAHCACAGCAGCAQRKLSTQLDGKYAARVERDLASCVTPVAFAGRLCRWCERRQLERGPR